MHISANHRTGKGEECHCCCLGNAFAGIWGWSLWNSTVAVELMFISYVIPFNPLTRKAETAYSCYNVSDDRNLFHGHFTRLNVTINKWNMTCSLWNQTRKLLRCEKVTVALLGFYFLQSSFFTKKKKKSLYRTRCTLLEGKKNCVIFYKSRL